MKTPYAHTPARDGDNTFLLRERDRRRRNDLVRMTLTLLPLGLGLLIYTWVQLETLATGYRISEKERELHQLDRQRQTLELTADDLARPLLVEKLAAERLALRPQTQEQTLYYRPDRRAGLGTPRPLPSPDLPGGEAPR